MRKLLVVAVPLLIASVAFAFEPVWKASHTATADTTQILCQGKSYLVDTSTVTTGQRGLFHGVCVNDSGTLTGAVTIYNSSSTATNAVAVIRSTAAYVGGCRYYDVATSSGLVYTNSVANDITILYDCY